LWRRAPKNNGHLKLARVLFSALAAALINAAEREGDLFDAWTMRRGIFIKWCVFVALSGHISAPVTLIASPMGRLLVYWREKINVKGSVK
jgi:hypothetical protein